MKQGARLARLLRAGESDVDYARALDMVAAAFSGDAAEARRLDHIDREFE
jgi:hypothetical protein